MPDLTPSEVVTLTTNIAHAAARRGLTSRRLADYVGFTNVSDCERYLGMAGPNVPPLKCIQGPTLVSFSHSLGIRPRSDLYNLAPDAFAHKYPIGPIPTDQSEIPTPFVVPDLSDPPSPERAIPPRLDWQPVPTNAFGGLVGLHVAIPANSTACLAGQDACRGCDTPCPDGGSGPAAETPTPVGPSSSGPADDRQTTPGPTMCPKQPSPPPVERAPTLSPMEIDALRQALPIHSPSVRRPRRVSPHERTLIDLHRRGFLTDAALEYALAGPAEIAQ